ncbi:site-specific integrase [Actinoplanes sp. LDG1-06]|uniref:Site-specific integrase n=1 Tax=Paractinoplanes ovalisporus TaxID=2810368 RepID=A0ABS2AMU9_9ACTN|nr:site-specific integrase [Actinoplanes ovalisporus]MBM2621193.1 site-specific integrase [Actinoplanes ovalisporus]
MPRPKVTRTGTDVPGVRKVVRRYEDGRTTTKYEVRVKDALGKLHNVGTYDDKPAARLASIEARADVTAGTYVAKRAGDVRFGEVAEDWLVSPHVRGLKPSTQQAYRVVYNSHCKPLVRVPVGRLGYRECSRLVGEVMTTHAPSTVRHVIHVLRAVLDHAVKSGYIRSNPARELKKPAATRRRAEIVLQPPDVERILAAIPEAWGDRQDKWRLLVELAVETGCRAGELFGLRVRALALSRRRLTVEETSQEVSGRITVGPPKSTAGFRTIDSLSPELCLRLSAHVAGMCPEDYVFGEGTKPHRQRDFGHRIWRPTLQRLGMTGVRFHDLRHYHASAMLLLTNGDVQYVSKRLGHARPSITLDVYGHVLDHQGRDISAAFADLRATARQAIAAAEPPTPEPAASATAGGVVDMAAWRTRRTG